MITDNLGGVGDGRNIENMLRLQNDEFASEGKGNFQTLFSEVVSSVGATVQSAELNLQSAEMIRDAAENAARLVLSQLSERLNFSKHQCNKDEEMECLQFGICSYQAKPQRINF